MRIQREEGGAWAALRQDSPTKEQAAQTPGGKREHGTFIEQRNQEKHQKVNMNDFASHANEFRHYPV